MAAYVALIVPSLLALFVMAMLSQATRGLMRQRSQPDESQEALRQQVRHVSSRARLGVFLVAVLTEVILIVFGYGDAALIVPYGWVWVIFLLPEAVAAWIMPDEA